MDNNKEMLLFLADNELYSILNDCWNNVENKIIVDRIETFKLKYENILSLDLISKINSIIYRNKESKVNENSIKHKIMMIDNIMRMK